MKRLSCTQSQIQNVQMHSEAPKAVDTDVKSTALHLGPSVFSFLAFAFIHTQQMINDTLMANHLLDKELST